MKKIKVFNGGSWIRNSQSSSFEDAQIVVMPGGSDWNPKLYGQKPSSLTNYWSDTSDARQMDLIKDSMRAGKVVFGICRGLQGITIANGGTLVQHIHHPGSHPVVFKDGTVLRGNSCHHQLCNPYNLAPEDYNVIAWTEGLSHTYIGEDDKEVILEKRNDVVIEPELIYYPKTRSLGLQGHPEWLSEGDPMLNKVNDLIEELLITNSISL